MGPADPAGGAVEVYTGPYRTLARLGGCRCWSCVWLQPFYCLRGVPEFPHNGEGCPGFARAPHLPVIERPKRVGQVKAPRLTG